MRRFWLRLTVLIVLGNILSIVLVLLLQLWNNNLQYQRLNPEFRGNLEHIVNDQSLSEATRTKRFKELFISYFETQNGFLEYAQVLEATISSSRRLAITAGLIVLPIGIMTAFLIARYISIPISHVSRAAKRVADGDFATRAPTIGRERHSEIGMLIEDFNSMASSLERFENERKSMIADIAHELRTPLTIIQGQIDAMHYGVVAMDHEQLAKLSVQTQLLGRLIKDLRTLSLAEARRLSLTKHPINLSTLLEDLITGFQEQAKSENIELVFKPVHQDMTLAIDADRIAQVIINIVGNAIKYTAPGGKVEVALNVRNDNVDITVADTGEGLSAEALNHVFDRFYRTDSAGERSTGGTGLGLAISKALVELHGGTIEAMNRPSGGAVFSVSLPLDKQN
jgi:two-component system, OmpR family, sensor histidine kinase BaeS